MTVGADKPQPLLRFAGCRPLDGGRAPTPLRLVGALIDHARASGLTFGKLERSRSRTSGSIYLSMTQPNGRVWLIRVSNHRRGTRATGHAIPHIDLVSLDGTSGFTMGRKLIDAIIADQVPWFDTDATIRPLAQRRRNSRKRHR